MFIGEYAQAFATKNGISLDQLQVECDGKAEKLVYRCTQAGKPASELLPAIIEQALDKLPIPKRMRWGDSRIEFVRPAQWMVMMLGSQVIDCDLLGFTTGNVTISL